MSQANRRRKHRRKGATSRKSKNRRPSNRRYSRHQTSEKSKKGKPKASIFDRFQSRFCRKNPKVGRVKTLPQVQTIDLNTLLNGSLEYIPALFSFYPELIGEIPWISLRSTVLPSVPKRLQRSQHFFDSNYIYMKNESLDTDKISDNQARKLEFLLGEVLGLGAKKILGFSTVGSSHALAVAQVAQILDLKCEDYLLRSEVDPAVVQKTLEMKELGAKLNFYSSVKSLERAIKWKAYFSKWNHSVVLPFDGVCPISCLGYVNAMFELRENIRRAELPPVDYLFVPVESGTSLVGLELGRRILGFEDLQIVGVQARHHIRFNLDALAANANQALEILNRSLKRPFKFHCLASDFRVLRNYSMDSGKLEQKELSRWTNRFLDLEGLGLDFSNNSRGLYAMSQFIGAKKLENKVFLFWNTFSGVKSNRFHYNLNSPDVPGPLKRWAKSA